MLNFTVGPVMSDESVLEIGDYAKINKVDKDYSSFSEEI